MLKVQKKIDKIATSLRKLKVAVTSLEKNLQELQATVSAGASPVSAPTGK